MALFLEGAPVSAYPEGPWQRALRFAARHRVPILLVAAYLVMRVLLLARGLPGVRAKGASEAG